jgi:hypothetical protein
MTKDYGNNFTLWIEAQLAAGSFNGAVLCSFRTNLRPIAVSMMKGNKS